MHTTSSRIFFLGISAASMLSLLPASVFSMRWPPDNGVASSASSTTGRPSNHSNRKKPELIYVRSQDYRRNEQRRKDVTLIAKYIYQYAVDHRYNPPSTIPVNTPIELCKMGANSCKGLLDLSSFLNSYADTLPIDPAQSPDSNSTGYAIEQDRKGKVTVTAPHAEGWIIKAQK